MLRKLPPINYKLTADFYQPIEPMTNVTQLTLNLPTDLLQNTEAIVQSGIVKSLDELVIIALQHEIIKIQQIQQIQAKNNSLPANTQEADDPIWGLGENPVVGGVSDASTNIDQYLYNF